MFTIYKATNKTNGHSYIGFDSKWPYRRANHKSRTFKGKSTLVFHNALRSYGWDNFNWEIVEQSEEYQTLLNEREGYYIQKFNTFYLNGNGYNMTLGGEATMGHVMSDETKEKIAAKKRGKPSALRGRLAPWTTKRNTESKGIEVPKRRKTYLLTSPDGIETTVVGIVKFAKENGLHAGNLVSVANGKLKQYKRWLCQRIN